MHTKDEEAVKSAMKSLTDFIVEMKEENDRAAVIIGAANIDTLLETLIRGSLLPPINDNKDELLDRDSPLLTFSSRINLTYRLALIDRELRQMLHILRKIRNDFAHEIKGCDLNLPPHSDRVRELIKHIGEKPLLEKLRQHFFGDEGNSRDFRIIISLISALLEMKIRNLPNKIMANPVSINWIPKDVEIQTKIT